MGLSSTGSAAGGRGTDRRRLRHRLPHERRGAVVRQDYERGEFRTRYPNDEAKGTVSGGANPSPARAVRHLARNALVPAFPFPARRILPEKRCRTDRSET